MKKKNDLDIASLSKKDLAAASKGTAKKIQQHVTAVKNDRKTLRAVVQYLCTTESEEAAQLRSYLGVAKNANKDARNNAVAWIKGNLAFFSHISVIRDGVETIEKIAVTKAGRYISDQIDAIKLIAQSREKIKQQRKEMLAYLAKARKASKQAQTYERALPILIETAKQAPAKYKGVEIEARFVLVDGVAKYPKEGETLADIIAVYTDTADSADTAK